MSLEDALKNAGQALAREYEDYDVTQRRTRLEELIRAEDAELRAEDAERAFHPSSRKSPNARAAAALQIAGAERDVAAGAVSVLELADVERGAADESAVAVAQAVAGGGAIRRWVEDWTIAAACRGMDPDELFVQGASQNRAKTICAACPVRTECLADALDNRVEFGVWGGMTERERRALLRRRPDVRSWRTLLADKREQYLRQRPPAAGTADQAPA